VGGGGRRGGGHVYRYTGSINRQARLMKEYLGESIE
jgi:hypothetical protein